MSLPIAVQMYTVREAVQADLLGALRRVAELGYDGVELHDNRGLSAAQIGETLNELSLTCVSGHVSLDALRNNLEEWIEFYQALNASYLVCPWLPPEERGDAKAYEALASELNQFGERCRLAGLRFCYHHHDFELTQFDGKYALDILLDQTDPTNVQLEADTYWLKAGGTDPAAYIRGRADRVPLVHMKDMALSEPFTFAEVGTGSLDWPAIFAAAQVGGAAWYIVEQDVCPGDPFDSIKISLENLRWLLGNEM